jgi:hypothetical protein
VKYRAGIWRPVSLVACRWLPVSRRCAGPARTIANRFGPAAEPATGVTTDDVLGETSQPGVRTPAGALPPDPVRTLLRTSVSGPLPQGRHRILSVTIVGLAPRVLPLTPQVVFFVSAGRRRFRRLPSFGSYRASAVIAFPGAFQSDRSIRDNPSPFSDSGCDTGVVWRLFCSSITAGLWITTLARSNNYRSLPTAFAHKVRNPGPGGVTRLRSWFLRSAPLVCVASRTAAARRLASWLLSRRGTTLPEEAGDICLKGPHSR